jgi:hypothetical protein
MAAEEMIKTITNLLIDYCPLSDPLCHDLMSWFLIYTYGAKHFDHPCHLSATGPDDFANNRLGKLIEAISWNASVTTFSDLSLCSGRNQEKEIGTRIIFFEKRLRHTEEYERLCQLMRDGYFENGQITSRESPTITPTVIIGDDGFIDRKLKDRTIHLYVVPFKNHVPGFFYSKLEKEIVRARDPMKKFWEEDLSTILERYNNFPRIDWLKNQDEQSWLPILAPAKAHSDLLDQPIFFERILTLAKKMVTSKKMEEDAIPLQQKVLEATLAFVEEKKPLKGKKANSKDLFYYGPDLFEFIKTMLLEPELRKEKISEILNDHHVVKDTWRPRFKESEIEVEDSHKDEKKFTKKKKEDKIIQPVCYAFRKDELSAALKNYL